MECGGQRQSLLRAREVLCFSPRTSFVRIPVDLKARPVGQTTPAAGAPFVNANVPRAFIGSVLYQQAISLDPALSAGIESGGEFPIGTTTNCFVATDVAGNSSSCCFTVTVNEYPNAIQSLVCNDLVQVSVDENCQAVINADQVLEGGPYGCYNNYIVEFVSDL